MFKKLGPGFMIAAAAVGVSHLVQSTRAGADYGMALTWLIFAIVILKYPAFRFATDYAAVTGNSLVHAYKGMGKLAMSWLIFAMVMEVLVGSTAVSLITAGLFIQILKLPISAPVGAFIIAILTAILLIKGNYARVESVVKILVITFSILVLLCSIVAVTQLGSDGREILPTVSYDLALLGFILAMTGWMPLPMSVSIYQSAWVKEKVAINKADYSRSQAVTDLNIGWILTLVLAICFVVMGTAILFQSGTEIPNNSVGFATSLFSIFTQLVGGWIYPIIAITGLAVIWSTLITIMDGIPRLMDRITHELLGERDPHPEKNYYRHFLFSIIFIIAVVMMFFLSDFSAFIDFSASVGFVFSPALAYYNYRAVMSADVAGEYQPSKFLIIWSWLAVVLFSIFALCFFWLRFFN
jgi:Mn2+/Fe2+ NRAMP family transporter